MSPEVVARRERELRNARAKVGVARRTLARQEKALAALEAYWAERSVAP